MNINDVSNTPYTYCGITAPVSLWISAGMTISFQIGDRYALTPRDSFSGSPLTDGELIEARITTGDAGEKALVWLIGERRRQSEERARNRASQTLADAQKKAGDDAIHAARIHRQAEELRCLAAGISKTRIEGQIS